jgi:hypothetical protein
MAAPSETPNVQRTEKYFRVPNEFAEHQAMFKPSERALALILFRDARDSRGFTNLNGTARISNERWVEATGLQERSLELAVKGLEAYGLEVNRPKKTTTPSYSWNWNKWDGAFRNPEPTNADPKRKERDAKAAATKVHPDCATGCAKLREMAAKTGGSNQGSPLLVMPVAQPVARPPIPEAPKPKPGSLAEKEVTWALTLAAMRTQFASAGADLLVRLLAVLVSFVKLDLSDYVLAEAVKEAYADSRGRWNSPILLLKTVPEVLKGWKAKGQPMDDPGDPAVYTYLSERKKGPPPDPPGPPRKKRAIDYI